MDMLEVDLLEHAAVKAKWYFNEKYGSLQAGEVAISKEEDPCELYFSDYKAVNDRQLPHRIEVRIGDETFGVIHVNAYQLPAGAQP